MKLLCIVGSVAKSHRTRMAIDLVADGARMAEPGLSVRVIDLSESTMSIADGRPLHEYGDDTADIIAAMRDADCFILASPIYRGGYTGALKNLLDHAPLEALEGKVVGLLASGATAHHYLAIDFQMRGTLAWFNPYLVPGSVYVSHHESATLDSLQALAGDRLRELGAATVTLSRRLPREVPQPYCLAREMMKR